MTSTIESAYTNEQTTVWIQGLVALAWADGRFDEMEQNIITELLHQELTEAQKTKALEPVSDMELALALGQDVDLAENFLRTAVMVALADGDYSAAEDAMLQRYCEALNRKPEALQLLRTTLQKLAKAQPVAGTAQPEKRSTQAEEATATAIAPLYNPNHSDVLHPVRDWLDRMDVQDPKIAKMLCKLIPPQCPFERDVTLFGRRLVHIPPLCKLNPLYEQLVGLRFRALCYLADDCGEDVSKLV